MRLYFQSFPVLIRRRISLAHPTVNVPFSKLNSEHSTPTPLPNLCPKIITGAVATFPLLLRRFRGCKITDSRGYYPTKGEEYNRELEDTALVQLSPRQVRRRYFRLSIRLHFNQFNKVVRHFLGVKLSYCPSKRSIKTQLA